MSNVPRGSAISATGDVYRRSVNPGCSVIGIPIARYLDVTHRLLFSSLAFSNELCRVSTDIPRLGKLVNSCAGIFVDGDSRPAWNIHFVVSNVGFEGSGEICGSIGTLSITVVDLDGCGIVQEVGLQTSVKE